MGTPKGLRCIPTQLATGDLVLVYSNPSQILLQLRRQVPTEMDLLAPSFKVAVTLQPAEAEAIAFELLRAAQRSSTQRELQATHTTQTASQKGIVHLAEQRRRTSK